VNTNSDGFINASDSSGAISGADPSQYLCWDGIHPTAAGHSILAQSMYSAVVPEPSTYTMALAGLACGGYVLFRRRKRA
jgi:phospholipase/lecithinase/hemolysin